MGRKKRNSAQAGNTAGNDPKKPKAEAGESYLVKKYRPEKIYAAMEAFVNQSPQVYWKHGSEEAYRALIASEVKANAEKEKENRSTIPTTPTIIDSIMSRPYDPSIRPSTTLEDLDRLLATPTQSSESFQTKSVNAQSPQGSAVTETATLVNKRTNTTQVNEHDLFKTYLTDSQTLAKLFDSETVEVKLVNIADTDPEPNVDALTTQICQKPRESVIAQMGLENIGTNLKTLQTKKAMWREQQRYYQNARRTKIATLLVTIMQRLLNGTGSVPWLKDTDIETVREKLGLRNWNDCMELHRDKCLCVLRILPVFRFEATSFFKGLWECPPGNISLTDWITSYGREPNVKTGKGSARIATLKKRLAHYLGFSAPETSPLVPAPGPGVHPLQSAQVFQETERKSLQNKRDYAKAKATQNQQKEKYEVLYSLYTQRETEYQDFVANKQAFIEEEFKQIMSQYKYIPRISKEAYLESCLEAFKKAYLEQMEAQDTAAREAVASWESFLEAFKFQAPLGRGAYGPPRRVLAGPNYVQEGLAVPRHTDDATVPDTPMAAGAVMESTVETTRAENGTESTHNGETPIAEPAETTTTAATSALSES